MKKFAIIGDSHVSAFLAGARAHGGGDLVTGGGLGAASRFFEPFFSIENDRIVIDPGKTHIEKWYTVTGRNRLEDFPRQLIVSLGTAAAFFYGDRMWRQYGASGRPISSGLIDTIIGDMQREVVRFYRALIERRLIAAVDMTPPPQRAHRILKIMTEEVLLTMIARFQKPVTDVLDAARVPIIRLDIADGTGFLRPEFASDDPSHAGPDIGPLIVSALKDLAVKQGD